MRIKRRGILCLLLLVASLVPSSAYSHLRRTNEYQDESLDDIYTRSPKSLFARFLGLAAPDLQNTLLGSLISYFTPALRRTLQNTLKEGFDPLILSNSSTQELGEVFTVGDCETSATINYQSEMLQGLSGVQLDKIEMVDDSDNIDLSLLDGAKWNATWVFNASFPELNAQANATLHVDACGTPAMEHALNFSATVSEPSIYMEIAVEGETSNLILFQSTSRVNRAEILTVQFQYHMVDAELSGNFGNLSYVNLGVELGGSTLPYQDTSVFEVLIKESLQSALDEQLPFKPSSF